MTNILPKARAERQLPTRDQMVHAYLNSDSRYDGVFLTAVKTTGIFCHPTCTARKPKPENVEFFATTSDALFAGYRPCKRCKPMVEPKATPDWASELLEAVQADPQRRWRDADLRARDIAPDRARRWFLKHHGMTFHAYARGLRLGGALRAIKDGESVTRSAVDHGFESMSGFAEAVKRLTGRLPSVATALVYFKRIDTPLGPMLAAGNDDGLMLLEFCDRRALPSQLEILGKRFNAALVPGAHAMLDQTDAELDAYFSGQSTAFEVDLALRGTAFQESVWRELLKIPAGETRSYGDIAKTLGRPSAVRAVGTANGMNRLAIIVPCHRVIGADGKLTGYGGGLWRKEKLLALERRGTDLF